MLLLIFASLISLCAPRMFAVYHKIKGSDIRSVKCFVDLATELKMSHRSCGDIQRQRIAKDRIIVDFPKVFYVV